MGTRWPYQTRQGNKKKLVFLSLSILVGLSTVCLSVGNKYVFSAQHLNLK
jgi:hypothetical protein